MSVPETHRPRRRAVAVAALAPLLAIVAACGGGSAGTTPSSAAAPSPSASAVSYPVTVESGDGTQVTVAAQPKAIVSLSPSLTEMLFAIGAGGQVKAVDDQSNYPATAPKTSLSGFKPNAEAIAGYAPDLVVLSDDMNGIVAALRKLSLPVLVLPAAVSLEASYAQEQTLGRATGHVAEATALAGTTKKRIAEAVASVPKTAQPLKIYHEVDPTYYSVTSTTFIGSLYTAFGLKNIADSSPKAAGGYPQLSAEFVVNAAPDVIVLADSKCCQATPESVAKRPAFAGVPAVSAKKVVAVDDDIASRWGPRIADFAETLAKALGGTS